MDAGVVAIIREQQEWADRFLAGHGAPGKTPKYLFLAGQMNGTRLTIRLLAVFWATMSAAGLITEYLFRAAGIAPAAGTAQRGTPGQDVWGWNYTAILDLIALAAFGGLYWLYRNRERLGGGTGYAKDPVCGMQVQVAHAPATARFGGTAYHFCSDHCQHRFSADPARYTGPEQASSTQHVPASFASEHARR